MKLDSRSTITFLTICLLTLAVDLSAEQQVTAHPVREPRRWNASFLLGPTKFNDSEAHRSLGATFRIRLTSRVSIEPEFRYMNVPTYESSFNGRVFKHSDLKIAGHVIYDLRDEADRRVVPYLSAGGGWIQTRNQSSTPPRPIEYRVPVFPPPTTPSSSSKTATNWFWLGGAVGLRIVLPHGFFVSPEVELGGSLYGDLTGAAVIKLGYGF